jgi:hypothetical protein
VRVREGLAFTVVSTVCEIFRENRAIQRNAARMLKS